MAENDSKVFVVFEGPHDYTPALAYGEIVFMTDREYSGVKGSLRDGRVVHSMRRCLADYVPGKDFVIPTGSPMHIGVAFMLLAERGKSHKVLHWTNQLKRYNEVIVKV